MSVGAAVLAATSSTGVADSGVGPGLLGFLVVVALGLALVFLYRSLRRQLRRIDFDAEGRTDAERMRRDDTAGNDADR